LIRAILRLLPGEKRHIAKRNHGKNRPQKKLKLSYNTSAKKAEIAEFPVFQFFAVDGPGHSNLSANFRALRRHRSIFHRPFKFFVPKERELDCRAMRKGCGSWKGGCRIHPQQAELEPDSDDPATGFC